MTIDVTDTVTAPPIDLALETLPADVDRSLDRRDAWRRRIMAPDSPLGFITDLGRWRPGSTVTVAIRGGRPEVHRQIEAAARQVVDACNLRLDFGRDQATGVYRHWRVSDVNYMADIRISFDQPGLWSLVGMDSVDPTVGSRNGPVGGRPNQCSMNFSGFDQQLPNKWQRTVRHEFMHALAFHHEHQNTADPSRDEYRWADDFGYIRTRERGSFVPDLRGRRPGIYTYLSGAPNNWTKETVDRNLRRPDHIPPSGGTFDPESIMRYRFPEFFYRSTPSLRAPRSPGIDLSEGDRRGLALLYPRDSVEIKRIVERSVAAHRTLASAVAPADLQLEGTGVVPGSNEQWATGAAAVLSRFLKGN